MTNLSFILPAFNEVANLPVMIERIERAAATLPIDDYEIVIVDDHSTDDTPAVLRALAPHHPRLRFARLAARAGSHLAILCGLRLASGDCALILAADGQDDPQLAARLLEHWHRGYHVVWAVRSAPAGGAISRIGSAVFYGLMRYGAGASPETQNADVVLLDRRVLDALAATREQNPFLWGLIDRFGFLQTSVRYNKKPRLAGTSGWTLRRKCRAVTDAFIAFSPWPLRWPLALGGLLSSAAVLGGAIAVLAGGAPAWSWFGLTVAFLAGLQGIALGVLGEYAWRTLEEVRRRPQYLLENEHRAELAAQSVPVGNVVSTPVVACKAALGNVPESCRLPENAGTSASLGAGTYPMF